MMCLVPAGHEGGGGLPEGDLKKRGRESGMHGSRAAAAGKNLLQAALHGALLEGCFAEERPCDDLVDALLEAFHREAEEAYLQRVHKGLAAVRPPATFSMDAIFDSLYGNEWVHLSSCFCMN